MSGIKVTNQRPARAIADIESVDGTVDDENVDWDPDTTTGIPPGVDPGDVLTWDGDSWEPEPPATTGDFELKNEGGQSFIEPHGSMGSTETFDPTDGNVHTGTLNADCTFTLASPTGSGAALLELRITASGTHTWTWPGSVTWAGGTTPDAPADGETAIVLVESLDGGTSWLGFIAGGSGGGSVSYATPAIVLGASAAAGAASTVIRSDATIAAFDATAPTTQAFGDSAAVGSAAFAAHRDHKHAMPAAAITASGQTMATARLLGRTTASSGAIEEITVGTGLSLSAGALTATGGTSALDTYIWRPLMDGAGNVITDGTGQAVMAYSAA